MTRQYRQGDVLVRGIGRIPNRRSTDPSNGARGGSRAVRNRTSGRHNIGSNSVSSEPLKREPGATLELLFQREPDLKPGPFLAYLEQKYRLLGDMEMLREIRAYRAKHGL
jgi:hypothetical protein